MGPRKESQFLCASVLFAALTAFTASFLLDVFHRESSCIWITIYGTTFVVSLVMVLVCLDIWRYKPADSHTFESLISQYIALVTLRVQSPFVKRWIDRIAKDPLKATEVNLMRILKLNENTEYGKKYKLSQINSLDEYTRKHPITTHAHYLEFVERIMAGEPDILHKGPVQFLASTSGTTGSAKIYPITKDYMVRSRFMRESVVAMYNFMPLIDLKRFFRFHIFSETRKVAGNIPIGALSQVLYNFPRHNLIPEEYRRIHNEDSSYYVMALFALAEKELSQIYSFSADLMHAFMKFMVKNWENICHDIETGEIRTAVKMPEEVRMALSRRLKPDKERADYLRMAMKPGVVGLVKRAWPDIALITMAKSGGFKALSSKLIDNDFNGVNVIGMAHGATEGTIGFNLEGKYTTGEKEEVLTLHPSLCVWEFIPLDKVDDENPVVVQIHQLELGGQYELVCTSENGLYRCRFGDIINIVGFHHKLPKYQFLYRLGQRLNISYERTPESFLLQALEGASRKLHMKYSDFTTTESVVAEEITGESTKGHYIYFIEVDEEIAAVADLAREIDQRLMDSYELYKRYRLTFGSIGDIEIIQIKPGTLDKVKAVVMGERVNPQFKMPRVIRLEAAIRQLLNNRMK